WRDWRPTSGTASLLGAWKHASTSCGPSTASCFPPSLLRRSLLVETEPVRHRRDARHRRHPVQEDRACEVVELVLDHSGDVAREALLVLLAILVKVGHLNRLVPRHAPHQPWDAEAPFPVLLDLIRRGLDARIDHH